MINIGWNEKSKNYFLWNEDYLVCNICNSLLKPCFILNTLYNSVFKKIEQRCYCPSCFEKVKRVLIKEGSLVLVLVDNVSKENLIPVFPSSLVISDTKTFRGCGCCLTDKEIKEIDFSNDDVSQLKYSLKASLEGATVGLISLELKEKDEGKNLSLLIHDVNNSNIIDTELERKNEVLEIKAFNFAKQNCLSLDEAKKQLEFKN